MAGSFFSLGLALLLLVFALIGVVALVWAVSNRGASSERRGEESRREARQIRELIELSERLEARVEALETLLMESRRGSTRSRPEDRYRDE